MVRNLDPVNISTMSQERDQMTTIWSKDADMRFGTHGSE
jgi:hypothetical protein